MTCVALGLGLLSIGRPWGHQLGHPPSEQDALMLLDRAVSLGIRFFDTAPAYGRSERIFGQFLRRHMGDVKNELTISTKMGERWDPESDISTVDHRSAALRRSIDASLQLLGRVDVLQVHKATAVTIRSPDVLEAIDYARSLGIKSFGASVSDLDAAAAACGSDWCSYLQFPFSRSNATLEPIFSLARAHRIKLIVNRPFAMGQLFATSTSRSTTIRDAFRFIASRDFEGTILTGTKSIEHLAENCRLFTP